MLSIVIITCNRKDELCRTILSCINHSIPDMEFVIVDNGSTDGTHEAVKAILSGYNFELNYLYQQTNLGVAGARNVGFKEAKGEIVYFIDDDAIVEGPPDCFRVMCEFMEFNKEIGILATEIFNKRDNEWQCGVFPKGREKLSEGEVLFFIGASHFIRKSIFTDKPLYPSQLFYGAEEIYASILAWGKGYEVWYTPKMRVIHNPSSNTRLSVYEIARNSYINLFIVRKLLLPGYLVPVSWIMFVLRLFKFCRFNYKGWRECLSLYCKRFDKRFYNPIPGMKIFTLIRRFGFKNIL